TGGVDPAARRTFWEMIYQAADRGITVFVTTHYMDEAEYCNRVSIMVDGKIEALDTPGNLKKRFNAQSMDEVFHQLARKSTRKADEVETVFSIYTKRVLSYFPRHMDHGHPVAAAHRDARAIRLYDVDRSKEHQICHLRPFARCGYSGHYK